MALLYPKSWRGILILLTASACSYAMEQIEQTEKEKPHLLDYKRLLVTKVRKRNSHSYGGYLGSDQAYIEVSKKNAGAILLRTPHYKGKIVSAYITPGSEVPSVVRKRLSAVEAQEYYATCQTFLSDPKSSKKPKTSIYHSLRGLKFATKEFPLDEK